MTTASKAKTFKEHCVLALCSFLPTRPVLYLWLSEYVSDIDFGTKTSMRLKDNALYTCDKQKDTLAMRAEGGYWTWHSSHQRVEMLVHAVYRPPNQWWTNTKNSQQGLCSTKQGHPMAPLWTDTKDTTSVLKLIDEWNAEMFLCHPRVVKVKIFPQLESAIKTL